MMARTPSATSANVTSEPEVGDRLVERIHVDLVERGQESVVGETGEVAVDDPLEVRDVAFEPARQAHVLEALRVQTLLLSRQVGEVLRRDRRPAGVGELPDL